MGRRPGPYDRGGPAPLGRGYGSHGPYGRGSRNVKGNIKFVHTLHPQNSIIGQLPDI